MTERQVKNPGPVGVDRGESKRGKGDYEVGYGRPPKHAQFKPGQSGNPRGRPRGKRNKKVIWEQMMNERVQVREDGKSRSMTKYEALYQAHLAKAMMGDTKSAKFVMEEATRAGFGVVADNDNPFDQRAALAQGRSPHSDPLFENVDLTRLSEEEQIELARLSNVIDLGGDVTALDDPDFRSLRRIVNKGRGRNVTPAQ